MFSMSSNGVVGFEDFEFSLSSQDVGGVERVLCSHGMRILCDSLRSNDIA